MIQVENVWYSYVEGHYVLKEISFSISKGELVCIMGANGAGKTTLIKIISGLLKPTRGKVFLDGVDVGRIPREAIVRKIGVVFQNPDHQIFSETVEGEVSFALKNVRLDEREIKEKVKEALYELGIEKYRFTSPLTLSEGERKLVTLASVIALDPEIIMLDEPTAGQDGANKRKIQGIIRKMVAEGRTVIVVTHDVEFCAELLPRVMVMAKGRLVADGDARDILTNFEILREARLKPPVMVELAKKLDGMIRFEKKPITVDEAAELIAEKLGWPHCCKP
ncbi:MAG: energy-coupling factor ABC transporter ATP-binding protein [Candidatus Freyarchaeota archaeon]|nr:ABC transporter ATP-binding protein [Candidatus Freyrarchaeum guaymaensis]